MSEYTKRLYEFINGYEFVRSFYGVCPECGKNVFSIGDEYKDNKIKARFICECGKKWKKVVYSPEIGKYRYPQMIVATHTDKRGREKKVLKRLDTIWFVTPNKIVEKKGAKNVTISKG